MIGLHRGHVEVWSPREVVELKDLDHKRMGFSVNYQLYGPMAVIGPSGHAQTEERFIRLSRSE